MRPDLGCETEFFWLGRDACFRTKAARARTRSKTLRAQAGPPSDRQVLERGRASAAFPCARAVYIYERIHDSRDLPRGNKPLEEFCLTPKDLNFLEYFDTGAALPENPRDTI
jgi:hypothetical protein